MEIILSALFFEDWYSSWPCCARFGTAGATCDRSREQRRCHQSVGQDSWADVRLQVLWQPVDRVRGHIHWDFGRQKSSTRKEINKQIYTTTYIGKWQCWITSLEGLPLGPFFCKVVQSPMPFPCQVTKTSHGWGYCRYYIIRVRFLAGGMIFDAVSPSPTYEFLPHSGLVRAVKFPCYHWDCHIAGRGPRTGSTRWIPAEMARFPELNWRKVWRIWVSGRSDAICVLIHVDMFRFSATSMQSPRWFVALRERRAFPQFMLVDALFSTRSICLFVLLFGERRSSETLNIFAQGSRLSYK